MNVFVNRTLNLKKIQYVGFDMDHTLVRYHSRNFEALTHAIVIKKLIESRSYPEAIKNLPFDFDRVIRGLVIDRKNGNLLKLNRYSGIRLSFHGTRKIDFAAQKKMYKSIYVDLGDPNYYAVDTAFSLSLALLYAQLVDLKDANPKDAYPSYETIAKDLEECVDEAHRDGSLKEQVKKDLPKYIIKEPDVVAGLERLKRHDKKLFILTNSYYDYTKLLLDYAITPFLKDHKSWMDLFDIIITAAKKPRFFYDKLNFLRIDPIDGRMYNEDAPVSKGIYQGGCASVFTDSIHVDGEDILYIGDHIYGDILRLKKDCNWRTALVVEELREEIRKLAKGKPLDTEIQKLMLQKKPMEDELLELLTSHKDSGKAFNEKRVHELQGTITPIDRKISELITEHQSIFNQFWGETMRAGAEESFLAYQVERYACIYMATLRDLLDCSPRTYFRAFRRTLPHEVF
jgi:HAD superfamily 5'-nucleotidase-like hydrolase